MQWIDIVILAILVISAMVSAFRGFIKEILSLVAWIVAFFVASNFYEPMAKLFTFTDDTRIQIALALVSLFFGSLMIIGLINYLVTTILKKTGLSGTDRMLGMVFGLARGAIIVLAAAMCFQLILKYGFFATLPSQPWYANAKILPEVNKLAVSALQYFGLM